MIAILVGVQGNIIDSYRVSVFTWTIPPLMCTGGGGVAEVPPMVGCCEVCMYVSH